MGEIERGARHIRRIGTVQKALLTAAVMGGLMLIGAAPSPAALLSLGGKRNKYKFKHQTASALSRLAKQKYVIFATQEGATYARITPSGKTVLAFEQQKVASKLAQRRRWDKRWRVVVFDIPEKRRGTRDRLRYTMRAAGFYRLQDSVWLYPHDCEDFVALLKTDLRLGGSVLYMVVEKIENDSKLTEHFHIK